MAEVAKSLAVGFAVALAWCAVGAEAQPAELDAASELGVGALDGAAEVASAESADAQQEILPAHVFVAARRLHFDLVALRYVLGSQNGEDSAAPPAVVAVSPRHVFNQAQVLFKKTHQLGEEVAGDRELPLEEVNADWRRSRARPAPTDREIAPADVLRVIADTRDRIKALLLLRNVNVSLRDQPEFDPTMQPADVLGEILKIKRQLNRMLAREYSMRNVYEVVLQAVDYAGDLGAGYPPLTRMPQELQPLDVYARLVANFDIVRDIGAEAGIQPIDIRFENELEEDEIIASDVYDFAAMLNGELAYLAEHRSAEHTRLPRGEYTMPRTVRHWHVFQLIDVLGRQLRSLEFEGPEEAPPEAETLASGDTTRP